MRALLFLHGCAAFHLPAARRAPLPQLPLQLLNQAEDPQPWTATLRHRMGAVRRTMGNELQRWPDAAKEGAVKTLRGMPVILFGSMAASAALVHVLPSRPLATFLVTNPVPKLMQPIFMGVGKVMLPINVVVANIGMALAALPFYLFVCALLLSIAPMRIAMKCLGASNAGQLKELLHPVVYQTLAFLPSKLKAFGMALGFGNAPALSQSVALKALVWFSGPLNEELVFRGLLQGLGQRVINPRAERDSASKRRLTVALYLAVAAWFSLVHAHNLLPFLQAISEDTNPEHNALQLTVTDRLRAQLPPRFNGDLIPLRFKSVLFIAINQCLANLVGSFCLYSPLFARRGLVASIAAHSTWNIFAGLFTAALFLPFAFFPRGRQLLFETFICELVLKERMMMMRGRLG